MRCVQTQGWLAIGLMGLLMAAPAGIAQAEGPSDYDDFSELDLESLLGQTITTASKYEQKVSESPVAATVITAEEIAASGARSIPEVFYLVPGLDVIQTTSSSYDVSARGLNKEGSNTMLVMVDGRAVYLDLYGITTWDQLSISLEDIRAIEVILGPGSVMYGANAFSGVINIITFSAGEKPGLSARVMASDLGEAYGSVRLGGSHGDTAWKLNSACDRSEDWTTDEQETRICRFEGNLTHQLAGDATVAVSGGLTSGESRMRPTGDEIGSRGTSSFLRADYHRGNLEARWYTNIVDADLLSRSLIFVGDAHLTSRMHDFEVRHASRAPGNNYLIYGGTYRHQRTRYSLQEGQVKTDIYAGFVHDEWRPSAGLALSAGVRYDYHPQVGGHWAPRGAIVFSPHPDHTLRASYSKAFRDPSYIETEWRAEIEVMPGLIQVVRGDPANQSETIESVEIGYQGLVARNVLLRLAVFRNDMNGLIDVETIATYPPPLPPGIPAETVFQNLHAWDALGGEMALQIEAKPWLRISGSYSYVSVKDADTGQHRDTAPEHHARLALTVKPATGHQVQFVGRFRSAPALASVNQGLAESGLEDQALVDVFWNILGDDRHRLTFGVTNLFDERVRDSLNGIEHRRRVLMSMSMDF